MSCLQNTTAWNGAALPVARPLEWEGRPLQIFLKPWETASKKAGPWTRKNTTIYNDTMCEYIYDKYFLFLHIDY